MDFNDTNKEINGTLSVRADNRPGTALIRFGVELYAKMELPIGTLLSFRYDKKTKELCFTPHKYPEKL